jgi:putative peptide zinc metalloprotease protein
MTLEPRGAERIYVSVAGTCEQLFAKAGDRIVSGQPIVQLGDVSVDFEIAKLEGERNRQFCRVRSLEHRRVDDADAGAQLTHAREALNDLEERLRKRRGDRERLLLKSPIGGTILPPPSQNAESHERNTRVTWTGIPLESRNAGAYFQTGTLFCIVGDLRAMEAVLVINQSEISEVRIGQDVELQLESAPVNTIRGKIREISEKKTDTVPRQLSGRRQGEMPTKVDVDGEERPLETLYLARVPLEGRHEQLLLGLCGRAKICAEKATVAWRLNRYLNRTFRFQL